MAFLDNSGDIILDAVLTDTGRMRLAKGDGSFRIAKFALGDDEIDYGLYDKTHASGTAYYDLQILQTPVLESFTNNTSTMKTKLISIPRTSIMYLPEIVLNTATNRTKMHAASANQNLFLVAVDNDTEEATADVQGLINGFSIGKRRYRIQLDQGLNTTELSPNLPLDGDLFETQYIIEMDNRFGSIWSVGGGPRGKSRQARISFIDDDSVASYYLSYNTDNPTFVKDVDPAASDGKDIDSVISGPKGSRLQFVVKASVELHSNNYLFDKLGSKGLSVSNATSGATFRYLDTVIRVTGATTGYRVDVPVRFIKKQ
jgi:hypothetical protein